MCIIMTTINCSQMINESTKIQTKIMLCKIYSTKYFIKHGKMIGYRYQQDKIIST